MIIRFLALHLIVPLAVLAANNAPASAGFNAPVSTLPTGGAIHLKFIEGSDVRLRNEAFYSRAGDSLAEIRGTLSRFPGIRIERLFVRPEATLEDQQTLLEKKAGRDLPDLNLWYRIVLPIDAEPRALVESLFGLSIVQAVYAEPRPAPLPSGVLGGIATPDFEPQQRYLDGGGTIFEIPDGIDARFAWNLPGGNGAGVTLADIEYAWNQAHEDLSKLAAPSAEIRNGTPSIPDFDGDGTVDSDEILEAENHGSRRSRQELLSTRTGSASPALRSGRRSSL